MKFKRKVVQMNLLKQYPTIDWTTDFATYKSWLQLHNMIVTFTKADGTERTMHCTLRQSQLPINNKEEITETKIVKTNSITVWDLDKQAWRRFKLASVTEFREETNG